MILSTFFKRQESIYEKIRSYFKETDKVRDMFRTTILRLVREGGHQGIEEDVEKLSRYEHDADKIERSIILDLYQKALVPESRGDILGLLETFERLPNAMESICYQFLLQKITLPEVLKEMLVSLIDSNLEAYNLLTAASIDLFKGNNPEENLREIVERERLSDRLERVIIKTIYTMDELDKADKLLFTEITVNIGNISDCAKLTSERIELALIKRRA